MLFSRTAVVAAWTGSLLTGISAINLPTQPQEADLISAANQAKDNMMTFYVPNTPGSIPGTSLRPDIYYWWQIGGMMGQLIHHWNITGNSSLNDVITEALTFQVGPDKNFQPPNQTKDEGNDDQVFWAYAAMDAAEYNFPAPDSSLGFSWLGLAQAVFNIQVTRWDTQNCGGGLRWQINLYNNGYNYKNLPANGGLFQLSARLARFTGNQTYFDWAEKVWDWCETTGLVATANNSQTALKVYDGFGIDNNCSPVNTVQFSYNFGTMVMGAAMMYNATNGNSTWAGRVQGLMDGIKGQYLVKSIGANPDGKTAPSLTDPSGDILTESADEFQMPQNADNDDPSFKAYTLRWMAVAAQLCPQIAGTVTNILSASAQGAAGQCIGTAPGNGLTPPGVSQAQPGTGNNWCGRRWYQTNWDQYSGLGEQMSAMSVFQNSLIFQTPPPITATTGGTSVSQPDAGTAPQTTPGPAVLTKPITTGDKAGAAIMTIGALGLVSFALFFMVTGD